MTSASKSQTALIAASTWWAAPALLARRLTRLGFSVVAICPKGHPLHFTNAVAQVFSYPPIRPAGALARAISIYRPELIVPCDDRAAKHLHELAKAARPGTAVANTLHQQLGDPRSHQLLQTRAGLMALAGTLGIAVPETMLCSKLADLNGCNFDLPWVVKTSGSWGGMGVRFVSTREAARRAVDSLLRPLDATRAIKRLLVNRDPYWLLPWLERTVPEVIVQRFVDGTPANIAVACQNGKLLGSMAAKVLGSTGTAGPAQLVQIIDHLGMTQAAALLAQSLGLSGLHGFDFILDRAGRAWLIELNPRATQLSHVAADDRSSVAEILALTKLDRPVPDQPPLPAGQTVAFFPGAWCSASPTAAQSTFQDVPWDEPDLMAELVKLPWPNRSLLARTWQTITRQTNTNSAFASRGTPPTPPVLPGSPAASSSQTPACSSHAHPKLARLRQGRTAWCR